MNPTGCNHDPIQEAHQLYQQLTGQRLTLHLERQRQWALLLAQGYQLNDLRRVILYLQREIRATRRHVGSLKLSNLLQLDRFEEDLAISRVRLQLPTPSQPQPPSSITHPAPTPEQTEASRQRALEIIRQFRNSTR
jgi:hypothetical protein